ncbi:general odorant-binding protein 19d-like isoform X1 [Vanessa atalanta]|uniref:general odorant-binding protein 19d-like isoform X1 n=2 Tax=Vanessa atalanta TaxID=42275 RepID=UPI001FCE1FD7|nr:general odorant-binding protein 19d-like isoform X1 [Vanessa atalanta]
MTTLTILFMCCFVGIAFARSDEDIKKWFIMQALECSKEHPVSGDEIEMMKNHKIPNHQNAKCLVACLFKKVDWIDDKGMFNDKNAYKMSEKEYPDDQARLDNAKKLYETCMTVNKASVGDDKEGCERAALLATCLTEHAPKMGFLIQ